MMNTPIRINIDGIDKIASLHSIGPHLAEQIINYRTTHGYFAGPDDLAKIKGISRELAITLSPHIDWSAPLPQKANIQRDFGNAIFFFFALLVLMAIVIPRAISSFDYVLFLFEARIPYW